MREQLKKYAGRTSFHIPGHKGKPCGTGDFLASDLTELPGLDNLYAPAGIIKEAQERAAGIYGARRAVFLTNGSTSGLQAALVALCRDKTALVARNCHRSVFSALALARARPVYVYPENAGLYPGPIAAEEITNALQSNPDAAAVVIVSPTYEGVVSDIEAIAEKCRKHGVPLIIDEAHGAHFPFSPEFPKNAAAAGADVVISGLHKTLPVFGQSALLQINNESIASRILAALAMLQTSSPSYALMNRVDEFMSLPPDFERYLSEILAFRAKIEALSNVNLVKSDDLSRLVFVPKNVTPIRFAEILRNDYEIDIEAAYLSHAVAISSVADDFADFAAFGRALRGIDALPPQACRGELIPPFRGRSETAIPPHAALFAENTEKTPFRESIGRVSANFILTYPPGVPLIAPGEVITDDAALYLAELEKRGFPVAGVENGCIATLSGGIYGKDWK